MRGAAIIKPKEVAEKLGLTLRMTNRLFKKNLIAHVRHVDGDPTTYRTSEEWIEQYLERIKHAASRTTRIKGKSKKKCTDAAIHVKRLWDLRDEAVEALKRNLSNH